MGHLQCTDCGSVRPVDVDEHAEAIVEALRDHPDTQVAWVQSRTLAEKGHTLGADELAALLEEQERVEPKRLTDFYWSWITTLGIGRAAVRLAQEERRRRS